MPAFARRPVVALSAVTALVLVAFSGRYGYHRDELYFLACGRHLAWGYPDQPPLVPLLARLMSAIAPGSLPVLRLPSALAMGGVVYLTGRTAHELRASSAGQLLAAAGMAVSAILLGAGHLLSTTTFDLLLWTAFVWLVVRILRTGEQRLWLPVGVVAGVALLDKGTLVALVVALVAAILLVGPRDVLRSWWLVAAVVIAALMWTPYLVWQARNGWPQLHVAGDIANGGSGTSAPRAAFVPMVLALDLYMTPVWVAGLVRLLRDPAMRRCRAMAVGFLVLCALVLAAGGKPYYVTGMFPVLLAAGAEPTLAWMRRARLRRGFVAAALALSVASSIVTLPWLPLRTVHRTQIVAINYDVGETIGWPAYVHEIAGVYDLARRSSNQPVGILASNYGEAGAVDRYGPPLGLPHAHSGHNGYWWWGPPYTDTVVAVGYDRKDLGKVFRSVQLVARLDNHVGVDDDEQGAPVWVCSDPVESWSSLWRNFRALG